MEELLGFEEDGDEDLEAEEEIIKNINVDLAVDGVGDFEEE